ncbi:MAG TPA: LysR substrate-binding domain-containing protein [Burkholderiaceae bacterium]|nr:LysR substrate-binding domain-containing protein [Burkholderiaceae bacterium]
MDRLLSMQAFVKVVDAGGFAAAARAMEVSASVVTRLVADLEQHLGARLIQRSTRRIALTPTGMGFLDHARRILGAVQEAEAEVSSRVRDPEGRVRVALPGAWAARAVARELHALRAAYPRLTVEIAVAEDLQALSSGYDIALTLGADTLPDSDAVARRLHATETVLCAAPDYLRSRGVPQTPADLLRHERLFDRPLLLRSQDRPEEEPLLVEPGTAFQARQPDTLLAAALAGLGLAALPRVVMEEALAHGRLVQVLPGWQLPSAVLWALVAQRRYLPAAVRVVLEHLGQAFATQRPALTEGGARPAPAPLSRPTPPRALVWREPVHG